MAKPPSSFRAAASRPGAAMADAFRFIVNAAEKEDELLFSRAGDAPAPKKRSPQR